MNLKRHMKRSLNLTKSQEEMTRLINGKRKIKHQISFWVKMKMEREYFQEKVEIETIAMMGLQETNTVLQKKLEEK